MAGETAGGAFTKMGFSAVVGEIGIFRQLRSLLRKM
jgi:hypothetical protein